jgi:hypothetical protein
MQEFYDRVLIVYLHSYGINGTVEQLGAYASVVRYIKDGEEYEEMIDNNEFAILDELVFEHIVED